MAEGGDWGLIGQEAAVGLLAGGLNRARVPQGLLLAGPEGTGKRTAALRMAASLLCARGPAAGPCGECAPCRHYAAGTAPDYVELSAARGEEIRIDQIRDLTRQSSLTPQESGRRVVLVDPAEAMNDYAANALLKLLEEPPGAVHFLLISHRPDRLLATIRSRCQTVAFRAVAGDRLGRWLAEGQGVPAERAVLAARLSGGAPGRALALAERDLVAERDAVVAGLAAARTGEGESVLELAASWAKAEPDAWLPHLLAWLRDLARVTVSAGRAGDDALANPDRREQLAAQAAEQGFAALDALLRAAERLAEAVAGRANTLLAAEEFLLAWRRPERAAPQPRTEP
ncbi:MAG TPA: DNA polymerase III subunit delta' [Gammaproteobacteria bacterium]|nr:DNA polymerase III subunit delta' [Gammaproteobacteria bacterium]